MIAALDVYYGATAAKAVAVLFEWSDTEPKQSTTAYIEAVEPYEPGQFYKRELPCLLALLQKLPTDVLSSVEAIIVDGNVYISNEKSYGLGGHLWESLEKKIAVIGVSKSKFRGNEDTVIAVYRGESRNPLYVSAIGTDAEAAAKHIRNMSGTYRIPDILKTLDQLTKQMA